MIGAKESTLFRKACPKLLLERASVFALEGTKKIGCNIAKNDSLGKVHNLLNRAWEEFWASPSDYHLKEKELIKELKRAIGC